MSNTPQLPNPLYPIFRAWKVVITTQKGQSYTLESQADEPTSIRMSFDVALIPFRELWWGEVTLYNLTSSFEQQIIQGGSSSDQSASTLDPSLSTGISQGDRVDLYAGYKTGPLSMNLIFSGTVYQPMWERENVVDFKLTLRIFNGIIKDFMTTSFPFLSQQRNVVAKMAESQHGIKFSEGSLANIPTNQLPRGGVIFGDPKDTLDDFTRLQGMTYFPTMQTAVEPGESIPSTTPTIQLGSLGGSSESIKPSLFYSVPIPPGFNTRVDPNVNYTIIGSPQQTLFGIDFDVLLDPRLVLTIPAKAINIDMSSTYIRQLAVQPGMSSKIIPPPDLTGNYLVCGVRHHGDSRGREWYTSVTAVQPNALALNLFGGGNY